MYTTIVITMRFLLKKKKTPLFRVHIDINKQSTKKKKYIRKRTPWNINSIDFVRPSEIIRTQILRVYFIVYTHYNCIQAPAIRKNDK